jgi:hypothetical protein
MIHSQKHSIITAAVIVLATLLASTNFYACKDCRPHTHPNSERPNK